MTKAVSLTAARLKQVVHYDPESGRSTVIGKMRGKRPGDEAGYRKPDGYLRITIDGVQHGANRLAWLYMTGSFPDRIVDHRDRNPTNDRWLNLRLADQSQNMANRAVFRTTKSGRKGVYAVPRGWVAIITARGARHYLGYFKSIESAASAYAAKAIELHGEFAHF